MTDEMFVTRREVLRDAVEKCYEFMYKNAQPSADFHKIVQDFKQEPEEMQRRWPLYSRYYLSQEDTREIEDMFTNAYKVNNNFKDHMDLFKQYLYEGGSRDIYVEANDERPGYRSYAEVQPVVKKLKDKFNDNQIEFIKGVFEQYFDWCTTFYGGQREQCSFLMSLDASPNTNPEMVKQYWKEVHGKDIEINEKSIWDEDDEYWNIEDDEDVCIE